MARLLGVDAGRTVVRTVLVRTSYRRVAIEAVGEVPVQDVGGFVEGVPEAEQPEAQKKRHAAAVAEAIRAALAGQKADAASVALSGERTFFRRLELPAAAQKELESVLGFELEATVPFDIAEATYDYRILKRAPSDTALPIFAALARTDDVRDRIAVVREAVGFEPERVGVGALPLVNLTSVMPEIEEPWKAHLAPGAPPPERGPVAILELGETTTDVVVVVGGEAVFARTLSRGTVGLPASAPTLGRELRQTFAAWRAQGGAPLSALWVAGGGAQYHGVETFLSGELGVAVLPLPTPRIDGLTPDLAPSLPRFAKALGLAVGLAGRPRTFNLRRGALEAERRYPFLREKIPLLSGLAAVIVVSFGFSIVAESRALDSEREVIEARLAQVTRDVLGEETSDPDKARELLEKGPGADEDPLPRVDAFDVMVQLSKAVPKDVVHDIVELDVARGHVVIQGLVPTNRDAEHIAEQMKSNRCFRDVKIPRTTQFAEGKQKYVLEFDLKCEDKKKKPDAAAPADSASAAAGSASKPEAKPEGR
jgi:general secretion pathway protein L